MCESTKEIYRGLSKHVIALFSWDLSMPIIVQLPLSLRPCPDVSEKSTTKVNQPDQLQAEDYTTKVWKYTEGDIDVNKTNCTQPDCNSALTELPAPNLQSLSSLNLTILGSSLGGPNSSGEQSQTASGSGTGGSKENGGDESGQGGGSGDGGASGDRRGNGGSGGGDDEKRPPARNTDDAADEGDNDSEVDSTSEDDTMTESIYEEGPDPEVVTASETPVQCIDDFTKSIPIPVYKYPDEKRHAWNPSLVPAPTRPTIQTRERVTLLRGISSDEEEASDSGSENDLDLVVMHQRPRRDPPDDAAQPKLTGHQVTDLGYMQASGGYSSALAPPPAPVDNLSGPTTNQYEAPVAQSQQNCKLPQKYRASLRGQEETAAGGQNRASSGDGSTQDADASSTPNGGANVQLGSVYSASSCATKPTVWVRPRSVTLAGMSWIGSEDRPPEGSTQEGACGVATGDNCVREKWPQQLLSVPQQQETAIDKPSIGTEQHPCDYCSINKREELLCPCQHCLCRKCVGRFLEATAEYLKGGPPRDPCPHCGILIERRLPIRT